jgi:hypothetical protein
MKSFNQYITEAKQKFVKGWTLKNKIHTSTTDFDNYHIKHVVNRPSKFGLTDKKILKIISDAHPDAPTEWPKEYLKELQKGVADNDVYIEDYLKKKGYCAFVLDPTHGSIQGWDEKSSKIGAKVLDDNYLPFEMDGFKLFEIKPVNGRPKYITNKLDWYDWVGGKAKRNYVSPMAQFREEITEVKFASIPTGQRKMNTVRGLEGPSASNLLQYLKNSSHKAIRFLVLPNGKMLVWDANDANHDWIQTGEGLGVDVLRGEMRIRDGELVVKHSKKRGEYAKKNRTLMDIKKEEKPKWFTTGSIL